MSTPLGICATAFVTMKKATRAKLRVIGVSRESGSEAPARQRALSSHVESELQDVAVLYHILFALDPQPSGFPALCERTELNQLIEVNSFRGDKAALEVRVDDAGCGWGFVALVNRPGTRFLFS